MGGNQSPQRKHTEYKTELHWSPWKTTSCAFPPGQGRAPTHSKEGDNQSSMAKPIQACVSQWLQDEPTRNKRPQKLHDSKFSRSGSTMKLLWK